MRTSFRAGTTHRGERGEHGKRRERGGWRAWAARGSALTAGALAIVLSLGQSAAAGGPTSVLLVQPGSTEATALYYSHDEYEHLRELLGEPTGTPGTRPLMPPDSAPAGDARVINATWLVHDVQPWRVDRIHASPKKGQPVWIHSASNWAEDGLDLERGVWHTAEKPDELRALLTRLGVMGLPSADGGQAVPWPADPESSEADTTGAPFETSGPSKPSESSESVAAGAGTGPTTGWWWAGPGLVVGAAAALLIRSGRLTSWRPRPRDKGPRQQVLEL